MDKSNIPEGGYCYKLISKDPWTKEVCPYWSIDEGRPDKKNGYCAFMGKGDWEIDNFALLWDKVKSCGVNFDGDYGQDC